MSLQKILASLVSIAIIGGGGYYVATQGLPSLSSGFGSDSEIQQTLDAALLNQFSIESAQKTGKFELEFIDSSADNSQGKITLTYDGGGNDLTTALYDRGFNLKLTVDVIDGDIKFKADTIIDFKIIDRIIYVRIGKTNLTGLPEIVSSQVNLYLALIQDKWIELPIEEALALNPGVGVDLETALATDTELRQKLIDIVKKYQPLLKANKRLSTKNNEIQIEASLDTDNIISFIRELSTLAPEQSFGNTGGTPSAEEWDTIEPAVKTFIDEVPSFTIWIGENDGYIHRTVFEASFDTEDLTKKISAAAGMTPPKTGSTPYGTIEIKFDSQTSEINQPYKITKPTDTVDLNKILGGLGAPTEPTTDLAAPTDTTEISPVTENIETPVQ